MNIYIVSNTVSMTNCWRLVCTVCFWLSYSVLLFRSGRVFPLVSVKNVTLFLDNRKRCPAHSDWYLGHGRHQVTIPNVYTLLFALSDLA